MLYKKFQKKIYYLGRMQSNNEDCSRLNEALDKLALIIFQECSTIEELKNVLKKKS